MTVREVPAEHAAAADGTSWVLSVHGGDRPGIVSAVVAVVAAGRGQHHRPHDAPRRRPLPPVAEVDLPADAEVAAVERELAAVAADLGVGVTLRAAETDEL